MPALRKLAVVLLTVTMLATGSLLASGAQGGSTHGHSGKGQYGVKPGCGPHKVHKIKFHKRHDCPKPWRRNR